MVIPTDLDPLIQIDAFLTILNKNGQTLTTLKNITFLELFLIESIKLIEIELPTNYFLNFWGLLVCVLVN